jgi:16S rRNA (cytidine1402-2'-O)-methyltransferase
MRTCLGARQACIARELTKRFEEVLRGSLDDLLGRIAAMTLKGEIVLIVAGFPEEETTSEVIDTTLAKLLGTHSVKDAARIAAEMFARPRQEMYMRALELKDA